MIVLLNGGSSAIVDPARGGMITRCNMLVHGKPADIFHAPPDDPVRDGFAWFGCWPMAPFANRAFGGRIDTPQGPVMLPVNDPANGNAMHGFAAQSSWSVVKQNAASAVLEHRRAPRTDPYDYVLQQQIGLEPEGALRIELTIRATGNDPLPFGLGFHPWFPCDVDTTFSAEADHVVAFAEGYRPLVAEKLDAASSWRNARPLSGAGHVANFLDWHGNASLRYPSRRYGLTIEASPTLRYPLLWKPAEYPFVCFEPQSHVIGAFSDPAGARLSPPAFLSKGDCLSGWMRLSVNAI